MKKFMRDRDSRQDPISSGTYNLKIQPQIEVNLQEDDSVFSDDDLVPKSFK